MCDNYVRELEPYSKSYIKNTLGIDNESFEKLRINKVINKNEGFYNFHYVGLIVVDKHVIHVYPKYILNKHDIKNDFKQVLKVINKYNKVHEDFDNQYGNLEDISLYVLSLMIFFIQDYYDNGVYHNIKQIIETNGNGEINWDRTINDTFPIIKNNKPFYINLQTNNKLDDVYDYFRLLHEFIITESSKFLEESGLLQIFDLTPVDLSDKTLDDFGKTDFILNKLKMELNVEFNSHKQKLLNSMHDYISQMNSFSNDKVLTVYGTADYEYVWEDVCSQVFENKLGTKISDLDLISETDCTLREYINPPIWHIDGEDYPKTRLRPDLITINDNNFLIFDAKYYHFTIEDGKLKYQPGLKSITKQYLYEVAYKKLIDDNNLNVKNAFLFPISGDEFITRGYVKLDIWNNLKLQKIEVIMVPANKVNQCYLENKILNIYEELKTLKLV